MAGKRVSNMRRAAWSIGAVVLLCSVAACTTGGGHGGGGGGGCTTPTQVHGGTPLTAPITGWYSADTRSSGNVTVDNTYPGPTGFGCNSALFSTGSVAGQDKAQLYSFADYGQAFSGINNVSYYTYKVAGDPAPDVAVNIQLDGTAGFTLGCASTPCFTTLVYEPYLQSGGQGAITNDTWQNWNATDATSGNGMWWSSKIPLGNTGAMDHPMPWSYFKGLYTDAVIWGYGLDVGSGNPSVLAAADGLKFGSTTTDF
jgi:hypothetical protein